MVFASHGSGVGGSAMPLQRLLMGRLLRVAALLLLALAATFPSTALAQPNVDARCAVKADGTLLCWGTGIYGRNGDGAYQDRFAPVRVGAFGEWKQVSGNRATTCAVKKEGTLWCWGRNDTHQLGNGNTYYRNTPQQVQSDTDWKQVSVEGQSVCGVKTTGLAKCWGYGTSGQLGDGTIFTKATPSDVIGSDWREIQTGGHFACGLKNDNTLWCWGKNDAYQFGTGAKHGTGGLGIPTQVDGTGRWASVNLGHRHGCGIQRSDASLWCWGTNYAGEVGNGSASAPQYINGDGFPPRITRPVPVDVPVGTRWKQVDAYGRRTCGLQENGSLWCWGRNDRRAAGPGTSDTDILSPQQVGTHTDWVDIGGNCGLRGTDTLECWSDNDAGSLAIGVDPFIEAPVQIEPTSDWSALSAGTHASCGIRNGELYCWGDGLYGIMGNGRHRSQQSPTRVGTENDWEDVHVGLLHACGLRSDKTLWCWGGGLQGQLGNNFNWYQPTPKKVTGSQQAFDAMDSGFKHTCAIADTGSLWCWGGNTSGEVGQTPSNAVAQPAQVGADVDWKHVSTGTNHSCALKNDNSLWCWGSNLYGQLGQGHTGGNTTAPTRVGNANDWRQVSAGYWGSCATKNDNTLWCWGELDYYRVLGMQWSAPTQLHDHIQWQKAAADLGGFCGLDTQGYAWCWGRVRSTVDYVNDVIYQEPHRMSDTLKFDDIDMGNHHVLASTATDEMWCWHEIEHDACGQGNNAETPVGIVDHDAPSITITDGPRQPDDSATDVSFHFTANEDARFECRLDDGPWQDCTSATTYQGVPRGARQFQIRATDLNGNTSDPVQYDWNASDSQGAPTTTITSGPINPATNSAELVFEADQNDATFKCRLVQYGQPTAWADCDSPVEYSDLADGDYRFEVYAISADGAVEPEIHTWSWSVYVAPISSWGDHSCLVNEQHRLYCWGANSHGQLGLGDRLDRALPVRVGDQSDWAMVRTGRRHSCAVNLDGQLYCWGDNRAAQLGLGADSAPMITVPTNVAGDEWRTVAVGDAHSCALQGSNAQSNEQRLYCWGQNASGQLGQGDRDVRQQPTHVTEVGDGWQRLSSGANHVCGVINNALHCWGDNVHGQLASGDRHGALIPQVVTTLDGSSSGLRFLSLNAGEHHHCAVTSLNDQRQAQCWGDNRSGQLGPGSVAQYETQPVTVVTPTDGSTTSGDRDWLALFAGAEHSCGLLPGGELRCWGRNERGQLGLGHNDDQLQTDQALVELDWQTLDGGDAHSCARRTDGSLHCWGKSLSGQLGNGDHQSTLPVVPPEPVSGDRVWASASGENASRILSGGGGHLCGVTDAGEVACWGEGDLGQLGDSAGRDRLLPVTINDSDAAGEWEQISVGRRHSCGLKTTGSGDTAVTSLYCWGEAAYGQLGDPNSDRPQPTPALVTLPEPFVVPSATGVPSIYRVVEWTMVSTGGAHSCAIARATEATGLQPERYPLYCWGNNRSGQLGTGDVEPEVRAPQRIGEDDHWDRITTGERHSCAISTDRRLWCWGDNRHGQLANGSDVTSRSPQVVGDASDWQAVAAGLDTSCARNSGGQVFCAGANTSGALGVGDYRDRNELTALAGQWQQLSLSDRYSCGLQANGRVYCWGANASGQLGSAAAHSAVPVRVALPAGDATVTALATAESTACALADDNTLYCWGANLSGEAGSDRAWRESPQSLGVTP